MQNKSTKTDDSQCEMCLRYWTDRFQPAYGGRQKGAVCEECCSSLRRLAEAAEMGDESSYYD